MVAYKKLMDKLEKQLFTFYDRPCSRILHFTHCDVRKETHQKGVRGAEKFTVNFDTFWTCRKSPEKHKIQLKHLQYLIFISNSYNISFISNSYNISFIYNNYSYQYNSVKNDLKKINSHFQIYKANKNHKIKISKFIITQELY